MKRLILVVLALASFSLSGSSAFASDCAVDNYDHNGSTMELQQCNGELSIAYSKPRSGLAKIGVSPGTLLFEGGVSRSGRVSGDARLFSAKCGEISYQVSGSMRGDTISLTGQAPKRNSGCRVTSHRTDNLLFTLITSAPQPAPAANDWYAIAGSFKSRSAAEAKVRELNAGGYNDWIIKNTRDCPNFTNGYWIATVGPLLKADATAWTEWTNIPDAYAKKCSVN